MRRVTRRMSEALGDQLINYSVSNNISGVESLLSRSDKSTFINHKNVKDDEVINIVISECM